MAKETDEVGSSFSRLAVSEKQLSLTPSGTFRCRLKTPYHDATNHVIFEPLDFIARLVALIPKPRMSINQLLWHIHTKRQAPCKSVMNLFFAFVESFRASLVGRRLPPTFKRLVSASRPEVFSQACFKHFSPLDQG